MIDVDVSQLHDLSELTKEMKKRGMQLTAQDLIANLMKTSPVKHGLLRSWFVAEQSEDSVTIRSPAIYAAAQNWGSTHMIKPRNKKALHWDGKYFSKGHMITIPPKHFVERSIEATSSRLPEFFTINGG